MLNLGVLNDEMISYLGQSKQFAAPAKKMNAKIENLILGQVYLLS